MLVLAARLDYRALAIKAVSRLRSRLPAVAEAEEGQAGESEAGTPASAAAAVAVPTWREAIEEAIEGPPAPIRIAAPPGFVVAGSEVGSDLSELLQTQAEAASLEVGASWPPPVYGSYF